MTDLLTALVAELRHELAAGVPTRIHSRVVPTSLEPIQNSRYDPSTGKWQPNWDEMTEVLDAGDGMPFAVAFENHVEGRGFDALPQRSISEVGHRCHARHSGHCEKDGCPDQGLPAKTPLCERIVSGLVEYRVPIGHIAYREDLEPETVESLAVAGLKHAAAFRHRELHRVMRDAKELERDTKVVCPTCVGRLVRMRERRRAA